MNFLENIVKEFSNRSNSEIKKFRKIENLEEAVKTAAFAGASEGPDWTSSHQTRVSQLNEESSQKIEDVLSENLDDLMDCSGFRELLELVGNKIKSINGTGGSYPNPTLDSLTIYDTSLRIGATLGKMPEKVYLHPEGGKTIEGAEALGFDSDERVVETAEFPDPIKKLDAWDIEDFLCIKAEELKSGEISESQSKCGSDNSNESNSRGCS